MVGIWSANSFTKCDCPVGSTCGHSKWYRVERHDVSRSDCTVYDVYGPNGEHYEEYVYDVVCAVAPLPEEPVVEKVRKKFCVDRSPRRFQGRPPVIKKPPGGWFFYAG